MNKIVIALLSLSLIVGASADTLLQCGTNYIPGCATCGTGALANYCANCDADLVPNTDHTACNKACGETGQPFCQTCGAADLVVDVAARLLAATDCGECVTADFDLDPSKVCGLKCGAGDTVRVGCAACAVDPEPDDECATCLAGYYHESGECFECDGDCATCSGGTSEDCTGCPPGEYLSLVGEATAGTCVPCVSPCDHCTGAAATQCLTCDEEESYGKVGGTAATVVGTCVRCSHSRCLTCTADPTICTECAPGYYLSDDTCEACPEGCATCDDDGACLTCDNGSTPAGDTCAACTDSHCTTCSTVGTCTVCEAGWAAVSGACVQCENNCATCTSATACTSCKVGYNLASQDCTACTDRNCVACATAATCTKCAFGYGTSNGACARCTVPHATDCVAVDEGEACEAGYYLTVDKDCVECMDNCDDCNSADDCNECSEGYTVNPAGDECLECEVEHCDLCETSTAICDECIAGYRRDPTANYACVACDNDEYVDLDETCQPCNSACATCTGPATDDCVTCPEGRILVDTTCEECPDNCADCTGDHTKCVTCDDGYYLDSAACSECPEGCSECSDADTCTECENGEDPTDGECFGVQTAASFVLAAIVSLLVLFF